MRAPSGISAMVVMPNRASPVWTRAMCCIGPPVTSSPPVMLNSSATKVAQPHPQAKYVQPYDAVPTVNISLKAMQSSYLFNIHFRLFFGNL
jgi:hypothetical protein